MITAVDTNVLLDILVPGAPEASEAERQIRTSVSAGSLIVSEPVVAELAGRFSSESELSSFLTDLALDPVGSTLDVVFQAGSAWTEYTRRRPRRMECPGRGSAVEARCSNCGRVVTPRQHIIAEFIIGAHALVKADRLLTRDRGFYNTHFPALTLT